MSKRNIIEKWYKILGFPSKYDFEFYNALSEIEINDVKIDEYDVSEKDGKKNFLSFLYMCEELSTKYAHKGISEEILHDTLSDLGRWLEIWSEIKGGLYLGETEWLKIHMSMNLFKLGRLQFAFGKSNYDIAEKNIKKGDNIIEIHIPSDGPLVREECEKSIDKAIKFFKEFYPEYEYKCFTCHSWLLDSTLTQLLNSNSNILMFQKMFEVFYPEESYAIIRYLFKWNTTRESINSCVATSSFAQKVKDWLNNGNKFYEALGIIEIKA